MSNANVLRALFEKMEENDYALHALSLAIVNLNNRNPAISGFTIGYNRQNQLVGLVDPDGNCIIVVSSAYLSTLGLALAETLSTTEHMNFVNGPNNYTETDEESVDLTSLADFRKRAQELGLDLTATIRPVALIDFDEDED